MLRVVTDPGARATRVLQMSGLDEVVECCATLADAPEIHS
jgi:hypothetical protein